MGSVAIDGKNLDSVCFALDGNASYTLMRGRVLNSITVANQQEVKIARKNLTNGIYILEINDQVGLQQKLKIVFN